MILQSHKEVAHVPTATLGISVPRNGVAGRKRGMHDHPPGTHPKCPQQACCVDQFGGGYAPVESGEIGERVSEHPVEELG